MPEHTNHEALNTEMEYSLWDSSLSDIHKIWLGSQSQFYSENTKNKLQTGWNVLKPLWNRAMRDIKISEVQALLLFLPATTQRSAKEIYKKLESLAYSMDIINRERANLLVHDEVVIRPRIPLTDEDIENLKLHQGMWFVDVTLVLYYTGFRAGEFAKLKKSNVNLSLMEIIGGSKSPYGVNRLIPIHPNIAPILRKWIEQEPGEWLFPNEEGTCCSNRYVEHSVTMATAAYCSHNHVPHECRHTFYTNLQRNEENSAACVARLAGHNPFPLPVDVRVYSHPSPEDLRETICTLP